MHAMMGVLYGIFNCSTKYYTNSFCQQKTRWILPPGVIYGSKGSGVDRNKRLLLMAVFAELER